MRLLGKLINEKISKFQIYTSTERAQLGGFCMHHGIIAARRRRTAPSATAECIANLMHSTRMRTTQKYIRMK